LLSTFGDVHRGGGQTMSYSRPVEDWVLKPDSMGYPVPEDLAGDAGGESFGRVVALAGGNGVAYVERWRKNDFGDLRAVGYALFLSFVGEGEVRPGPTGTISSRGGGKLLEAREGRPIDATPQAYQAMFDPHQRDALRRRLAAVQRFWRSYQEREGQPEPGTGLAVAAARAFACWVCGVEPLAIGTRAARWSDAQFGSLTVPVARDAHLPKEG
jgi:hypothetical protein